MISDLSPVDQVWIFALILAVIVGSLAILVLLGPGFVREVLRDVRRIVTRAGDDSPWPTDPDAPRWLALRPSEHVGVDVNDVLARDAEIQEVQ